ncbi:hypothetical protein BRC82_10465 [Halobacteriales archaeon QS_1_67_19]|nr:MAG: hypothetical protein BRC82_10465 [Halobacteriales archaeon QS_1_67_19]
MNSSRRRFLTVGALALAAGCSARPSDDCTSGYDVSGAQFDPATDLLLSLSRAEKQIVAEAAKTGATTRTTYAGETLESGAFVAYDGRFYRTDTTRIRTASVTAYSMNIAWEKDQTPPSDADAIPYSSLPESDRDALSYAVEGSGGDEREGLPSESLSINDAPVPYPDGGQDSQLVARDAVWVHWNDRYFRVEVNGETTQEKYTYEYALTEVAGTPSAFREHVASAYRVDLTGLPDDQREIVRQALDEGYEECAPASEPLSRLQKRLPEDKQLPRPERGDWYVRFDGSDYLFRIVQWVR